MSLLQKNVTNFVLLIITVLSSEVDLKTEFLPEFENNVSTNITVQVRKIKGIFTFLQFMIHDIFHFIMDDENYFSL